VSFPDNELQLLQRGKKFAVPPVNKLSSLNTVIVADIANGIRSGVRLNSERVRNLVHEMG